jgi:hypothetical protein
VRGRVRLVLPGVPGRRAAARVQVVDEQGRHERLGGGGLEHLDTEPSGPGVRSRQHPVLGDRPGASGRGDVHRHGRAAVAGDRGAPPLQALGQRVVRPLLGHQAVADARIGAGRVGGAEQPAAGQRLQQAAPELGHRGPARVGAGRLRDRVGRHGEHVGGRGQEPECDIAALGQQAHGQRVDGAGHPDVGRAVGVDVVAQHERTFDAGQPVGHSRDVGGQVEAGPPGQVLARGRIGAVRSALGVGHRDQQGPAAAPRRLQHPVPDGRAGQVNADDPGAPAQQHRQRAHLGAGAEHHDRAAGHGQPLGGRGDGPDCLRAGRLDDARGHPRVQLAQQGAPGQPLAPVGDRELAFRRSAARHRDRGQLVPGRRRDQRAEPGLRLARPRHPHPAVQRRQPVPGHGGGGLPGGQPGNDQPAKMGQVAGPPVGFPAGGARSGRIGPGQRVGDHCPAERRGAPAAVRRGRKGHPVLLGAARRRSCRHQTIMTCGL